MRAIIAALAALLFCGSADAAQVIPWRGGGQGNGNNGGNANITAALLTAEQNPLCKAIQPFYWEIVNATSVVVSESEPIGGSVVATTPMAIASASKFIYGTYFLQFIGGAANLTTADIQALSQIDGYHNAPDFCPNTDTVNQCLAIDPGIDGINGHPYGYQDPGCIGDFCYNGAHFLHHAGVRGGLGNDGPITLTSAVNAQLGLTRALFLYNNVNVAGGGYGTAVGYRTVLQGILSGSLHMHDALFIHETCTLPGAPGCSAGNSPIPEAQSYSIAHWVENQIACCTSSGCGTVVACVGDGAASSPGALGFYPWIEAGLVYGGLIARQAGAGGAGFTSEECGRQIRRAFDTGVQQTGTVPL